MEGEQERLERMYSELGDEHLKDLHDDRDSLTLDGQIALARVLAQRGLAPSPASTPHTAILADPATDLQTQLAPELEQGFTPGIPGVIPSGAGVMEQALEHGGARRDGMVKLVTFFDGNDLTKACEALEAENIDFALEPLERDEQAGAPTSFAIWVEEPDRAAAEAVLRRRMGLFPLSEVAGGPDVLYDEAPMTLGEFETKDEAEQVKQLLTAASIPSVLHSGENAQGEPWHSVEVKGTDLERGLQVVESGLGAGRPD